MTKVFVFVLILTAGNGKVVIDNFTSKEACEKAYQAIKQNNDQDNSALFGSSPFALGYHECIGIEK